MTIKPIVYLLIINSFFTICANLTYGEEEVLVFHDSTTVYVLSTSPDGEPIRKELINNAYIFKINRSGSFAMSDGPTFSNRIWYKGRIDSSLNAAKHALPSIPPDVSSVAVSEDGKLIAWIHSEGLGSNASKTELTIEEYIGGESKVLRKISMDGIIPAFSFSPNGDLFTYFSGQPEAAYSDSFSLMLLDLKNPEKKSIEIAPPSLRTNPILPDRSNPLWSSNNERILFEARYKDEESLLGSFYIVSIDGRAIEPSLPGIWAPDGKYRRRIERIGDYGSGEYMVIETDVSSNKEKKYSISIGSVSILSLSPSGEKIAYVTDKEVFIYDTIKKTTVSYGTSHNNILNVQEFFWIFPRD